MGNEEAPTFGGDEFMVSPEKPKTRPGAVIVLLAAALGGGGYMFYKHGPASASAAAPTEAVGPNEAQKSIAEFLQVGGQDISAIEKGLRNTEQVVKQFNSYPSMTQVPLSDLRSNPFRTEQMRTSEAAAAPPPTVDESKALFALKRQQAIEAAAKLRVETIMSGKGGSGGTAIVNGEVVQAGSKIGTFTVESIKPGVVTVSDGTFRFERKLVQ